jgi:putative ABC transport system permease protein
LHEEIGPLVLFLDPYIPLNYFFVKIKPEKISESISLLRDKFHQIVPDHPFEYHFLDQSFNQLYNSEERWGLIVKYSSVLAILIAGFGLFGLSALVMTKRTKEIGIRKVAGASVNTIIVMLSKEFIKWIVLANIIAWPVAYILMDHWLQNFAYKIPVYWWIFLIAGFAALFIAWITIIAHAAKAALDNPIESLRYE